jgi:hypothetical protein
MAVSRSIFRQKALEQYKNRKEKKVRPHLISFYLILFGWLLFGMLCAGVYVASVIDISEYEQVVGVIQVLPQQKGPDQANGSAQSGKQPGAVLFVPASPTLKVVPGMVVQGQIEGSGRLLKGTVERVLPQVISQTEASQHYALGNNASSVITQPSIVVFVDFHSTVVSVNDEGKPVHFQFVTGTYSILSLMLGPGLRFII